MELPVAAQSERWIVVNKPPRLLVHRTDALRGEPHHALQIVRKMVGAHVNPVHRLDRSASGCLLFATDPEMTRILQEAMAGPDAAKTYLAFVRGTWVRGPGPVTVDKPMKNDVGDLRDALTEVDCVGTSADPRSSLLRARPRTGRFHQVRRHVRDLGHPVLLDGVHGDSRVNRWWRENRGLTRVALHCLSLDLPLPDGTRLRATSPVYADLVDVWRDLPWWDEATAAVPELLLPAPPVPEVFAHHRDTGAPRPATG